MHFSESQRADLVDRIRRLSRPVDPKPTGESPSLDAFPRVRAVLFDLYGTLFISAAGDIGTEETGGAAIYTEAAAEAGVHLRGGETADWGARFREEVGRQHARRRAEGIACPEVDVRHIWRAVLEPDVAGVTDEAILRFAVEVECRINPVWPMPGALAALRRLREQGHVLGIVSNAQCFTPLLFDALLNVRVEQAGFQSDACIWSWQLGEAKPSPRPLQRALAALKTAHGIEPGDVLFVGNDVLKDLHPAQHSGCRTALFAGDARSLRWRRDDPRCTNVRPDIVLTHLDQL
ncbi:MAG TPA: HAD family hydrolase [Kiritimatiellia bacterium]|nr:HAD family hydrolase [Kiritimatiellia bacterium]